MRKLLLLTSIFLGLTLPTLACFGPKLYTGVGVGAENELRFALVSLYLKEKTGVELERVELAAREPATEIAGGHFDLAFATTGDVSVAALRLPDGALLLAGKRVRDDLQFTTVLPALTKLQGVVASAEWPGLVQRVRAGEGALAVARAFFKSQGAL